MADSKENYYSTQILGVKGLIKCLYYFLISALLYSKFSEILVILRNFFEGSRKEDDEKSEALNMSSSSLFAKLGMFHPGFVYSLEFLKKYMDFFNFLYLEKMENNLEKMGRGLKLFPSSNKCLTAK